MAEKTDLKPLRARRYIDVIATRLSASDQQQLEVILKKTGLTPAQFTRKALSQAISHAGTDPAAQGNRCNGRRSHSDKVTA